MAKASWKAQPMSEHFQRSRWNPHRLRREEQINSPAVGTCLLEKTQHLPALVWANQFRRRRRARLSLGTELTDLRRPLLKQGIAQLAVAIAGTQEASGAHT